MRHMLLGFGLSMGMQLAASPFVVAADLETIQERGYLIVAVKDNRRPLGFLNEAADLVGFEIDIAARFADVLFGDATAVVFRPVANQDRLSAVLNDEVDMAIAGIAITPTRERIVDFSYPYYLDGTGFITNSPFIQSLQDLATARIALLEGSDAVAHLNYAMPLVTLVGVESYQAAFREIETGRVAAVAADLTVLAGWTQEYPSYQLLSSVLTAAPLAVVLPKGLQYESLRKLVNNSIQQWHEEGWLEENARAWGLP